MSAKRSTRFCHAWRRSADLIPAWRSAVARAVRRYRLDDVHARGFADAARDLGYARLDRGIPTSRRSLDRLMLQAFQQYSARQLRRALRAFHRGLPAASW
jgi:hypothetical protein